MIDRPGQTGGLDEPETNAEQDDEGAQAHEVAREALERGDRPRESEGSVHGGQSDPAQLIPDDSQDLVDLMTDMDHSGRIDMGAFEGEDPMDDEDGSIPD